MNSTPLLLRAGYTSRLSGVACDKIGTDTGGCTALFSDGKPCSCAWVGDPRKQIACRRASLSHPGHPVAAGPASAASHGGWRSNGPGEMKSKHGDF